VCRRAICYGHIYGNGKMRPVETTLETGVTGIKEDNEESEIN
jgi:hypothetical protein